MDAPFGLFFSQFITPDYSLTKLVLTVGMLSEAYIPRIWGRSRLGRRPLDTASNINHPC